MAVTDTQEVTQTRTEKGVSLARGPALILGTILLAAGLYFLYKQHNFLKFSNFPNGNAPVDGKAFFGIFGVNGWTGMLTAVAGGLLLFGAAQHLLAKTMSLIVGVVLGASAIIAVVSGNVLGMAAANAWTKLGWGVAAAILLINTLIPRRRRTVIVLDDRPRAAATHGGGVAGPVAAGRGTAVAAGTVTDREAGPVDRGGRYRDEPDGRYGDDREPLTQEPAAPGATDRGAQHVDEPLSSQAVRETWWQRLTRNRSDT
ncbi:MAG: hypothetical protein WAL22_20890 [Solirubrobacteraceae bacterium]